MLPPKLLRRGTKGGGGGVTVVPQKDLDSHNELRKAAFEYLRNPDVALQPLWKPNDVGLVIPSRPGRSLADDLGRHANGGDKAGGAAGAGATTAAPASSSSSVSSSASLSSSRSSFPGAEDAVSAFQARRKGLVEFDARHASARVIHVATDIKSHRRVLTHFYLFIKLVDQTAERSMLRLVRKFFHYRRELFCAAAKGVAQLRRESGGEGYSSFHIRRGDFQYKQVKMSAQEILRTTRDALRDGEMLYISTDETNHSFFAPFRQAGFQLRFLSDIGESVGLNEGILADPNYIGMVEQIVASKGRVFIGTWYSTFTGYINRLRGYYGEDTAKTSLYFWEPKKFQMRDGGRFPQKFTSAYAREWSVAWEQIDEP